MFILCAFWSVAPDHLMEALSPLTPWWLHKSNSSPVSLLSAALDDQMSPLTMRLWWWTTFTKNAFLRFVLSKENRQSLHSKFELFQFSWIQVACWNCSCSQMRSVEKFKWKQKKQVLITLCLCDPRPQPRWRSVCWRSSPTTPRKVPSH